MDLKKQETVASLLNQLPSYPSPNPLPLKKDNTPFPFFLN